MFIRKKNNKSGTISVQIISKEHGRYKLIKTIGCSADPHQIATLEQQGKYEIERIQKQLPLFVPQQDSAIRGFLSTLENANVQVAGPEIIFGKIYDKMGYNAIKEDLFRHLVLSRLAYPGSKLKTVDYLYRYQGISYGIDQVYRFLDKLHNSLKDQIEQLTYDYTLATHKGNIGVVLYDMTTLHFEASTEDELRQTGFSKAGKHHLPQIYLGILVTSGGYPIGYKIFEGSIYEGHTLIPVIQEFEKKHNLSKPIIVADAGLLSTDNILDLDEAGYYYILGARIKNENNNIKKRILDLSLSDGKHRQIKKTISKNGRQASARLIIHYSDKRKRKDEHTRLRGLKRLEKKLKAGRLTKDHINNRGYNKYLKLQGEISIEIDYEKFNDDRSWDGLKGYITNSKLTGRQVMDSYNQLWQIEKAFRISKTDLRIRPVYHRLPNRIEAHISIAFTAYAIYKQLERILNKEKASISPIRASELTRNMYALQIMLPDTKCYERILLKMDEEQKLLYDIINHNF